MIPKDKMAHSRELGNNCLSMNTGFAPPAIRFLHSVWREQSPGANAATGQPVSGPSQCSVERYHRTISFHRSARGTFCREERIFSAESENPCAISYFLMANAGEASSNDSGSSLGTAVGFTPNQIE